jgi:hypothetical protein
MIHIIAIDTLRGFSYRDSVLMPGEIKITEIVPNDRAWNGDSMIVRWSAAQGAGIYAISVRATDPHSQARGLGAYAVEGQLSYVLKAEPFKNIYDIIPGTYVVRVICASSNFEWVQPWFDVKPPPAYVIQPIQSPNITGAISAIVSSAPDTITVH